MGSIRRPLGTTLAALHGAGGSSAEPVDPWLVAPVGRDAWLMLVAELRAADAPFTDDVAALLDGLVSTESIIEPPTETIWCHRDLWADNVRAGADGVPVVIDWDSCGPASAAGEMGMLLAEYGTSPDRGGTLYRDAGGPARISGPGDFTMPVAVMGHLLELAPGSGSPPPTIWRGAAPPGAYGSSPTTRSSGQPSYGCWTSSGKSSPTTDHRPDHRPGHRHPATAPAATISSARPRCWTGSRTRDRGSAPRTDVSPT